MNKYFHQTRVTHKAEKVRKKKQLLLKPGYLGGYEFTEQKTTLIQYYIDPRERCNTKWTIEKGLARK